MIAAGRGGGRHHSFQDGAACELDADYVVVGSGAGGAAAAVVLARAGYTVALCEAGPWREPADYPSSVYGAMRDMWSDWGALFARGRSMIPIVQATCMGGSTAINSAIVVRTPGAVLRRWAELGLGEVFTEEAVGAAQDQIEAELEVRAMSGRQVEAHSEALLRGLAQRGLEGHATLRNAARCRGSGQCLQGCRNGAKQSTNVSWVPELLARGGSVLSCAPVARVLIESGRAAGVAGRFRHPQGRRSGAGPGARFTLRARRGVLVAASATGSAPLLQRSGVRLPALGKYWRGHPGGAIAGVYPGEIHMERGTTQGAASLEFQKTLEVKVESLSLPLEMIAARLGGAGRAHSRVLEEIPRMAVWVAAVRAEAEGTVRHGRFGKPVVRYTPTAGDAQRLRQALVELAKTHFAAGAVGVRTGIHGVKSYLEPGELHLLEQAPLDPRAWFWVLSHLFGGCVMGADPRRSVVAPDLCVRGVRALHVVDASCLPTTLGVNPQHTIMAVARIVAQRLAGEEQRPVAARGARAGKRQAVSA